MLANEPSANEPAHDESAPTFGQRLRGAAATLTIVGGLAGIAAAGHHFDWKLPGRTKSAATSEWCVTHHVPEEECVECRPELKPTSGEAEWCETHDLPECPLEHAELAQLNKSVTIEPAVLTRAERALVTRPRGENNRRCLTQKKVIQFASIGAAEKAGVDIDIAYERPIKETVSAAGELVYDPTRVANLASRAGGAVWRAEKQVGDRVRKGDLLALVDAAEVGQAKTNLLQALAAERLASDTLARLAPLANQGSVTAKQLRESEAALEQARVSVLAAEQTLANFGLRVDAAALRGEPVDAIARQLRFLGLPSELAATLEREAVTSNLLPLVAPLDGVVTARFVVPGEVVDTTRNLFTVCDTSRLWLVLNVRQDDAKYVALGQPVEFASSGGDSRATGAISWISTEVNHATRTVEVRVEIDNAAAALKANTFGAGRVVLRDEPAALVVPSEAVHWDGCCEVVFVRDKNYLREDAPKLFHVRKVRTGVRQDGVTEIIAGVLPGEVIASKNSVVLEAQLLKSNLGAGCCEAH